MDPGRLLDDEALASSTVVVGFSYDPRRRRVTCTGARELRLPYAYRGADDQAGANYTHQPAVDSYYEPLAI
jgi:hypothetical protein